jgi:hypothetical protein
VDKLPPVLKTPELDDHQENKRSFDHPATNNFFRAVEPMNFDD